MQQDKSPEKSIINFSKTTSVFDTVIFYIVKSTGLLVKPFVKERETCAIILIMFGGLIAQSRNSKELGIALSAIGLIFLILVTHRKDHK